MSQPFPPTALHPRHGQTDRDSTLSYKIEYVKLILTFLNPEGYHNRSNGSKVIAVFLNGGTLPIGGVALGRFCVCSLLSRLFSTIALFESFQFEVAISAICSPLYSTSLFPQLHLTYICTRCGNSYQSAQKFRIRTQTKVLVNTAQNSVCS